MAEEGRVLHVLSGGAAQGLVKALHPRWLAETGAQVEGRFGAVGAMKEALLSGVPCDVMIVTQAMAEALVEQGALRAGSAAALGRVGTGIAVRSGQPHPDVSSAEGLKSALLGAQALYFPDPERATAGIHFAKVLRGLRLHAELQPRFRTFPNGEAAMRALAASGGPGQLGCTQLTEILYTEGVDLVGPLPPGFELATVYCAAVSTGAADPGLAARFVALLSGAESKALRSAGGFEA